MPGWNVHLLALPSNESGADHATEKGNLVDTRFGANFWCGNTERLLCISSSAVFSEVAKHVPQYDEILVLVNTSKYGGAGYGSGIATASLANATIDLIRHEIAHSFAGLGDEYTYGRTTIPVNEPAAANLTLETNPTAVKWKHWMENPSTVVIDQGTGVGLWEGGQYLSEGVYRPTNHSLMRSFGQPFGLVNSEQWALSVYDYIQPIVNRSPEAGNVKLSPNTSHWFALESIYAADQVNVVWSVNGTKVTASADSPFYLNFKPQAPGQYLIKAEVTDKTGVIRKNLESKASQTLSWIVEVK